MFSARRCVQPRLRCRSESEFLKGYIAVDGILKEALSQLDDCEGIGGVDDALTVCVAFECVSEVGKCLS